MAKKVKKKTVKKTAAKKTVKKKAVKKTAKKSASKKKVAKTSAKSTKTKTTEKKKKAVKANTSRAKTIKASAKKNSVKKRPKRKKSILTAKELSHFRDLLIERLKEITGSVNHIENEALKTSRLDSSGDLSSMPIHMADLGSDNYEQEFALGLMDTERKIVEEIYEALKRIQNKTYGICEGTEEPIPKMRLEGIPWTRYCVKYAELLEKGLVQEPDQDYYDESGYSDDESSEESLDEDHEDDTDDDRDIFFYGYDDDDEDEEEELL